MKHKKHGQIFQRVPINEQILGYFKSRRTALILSTTRISNSIIISNSRISNSNSHHVCSAT